MSEGAPARSTVSLVRRIIVGVIIASFGLAAFGGIVVLLGAQLGDTAARVLGTTAVIGTCSVAVLCCAALAGRRLQAFGLLGAAVSAVAAVLVIWVVWYRGDSNGAWDLLFKCMWTAIAAAAAFALASLLLLLADRHRAAVRAGLALTLALFAVVLAMTIYLIWWSQTIDGDMFARVLGIASILAALGAVIVPVLSLLLPDSRTAGGLPVGLAERLVAEAERRGVTVEQLVAPVLTAPAGAAPRSDDAP